MLIREIKMTFLLIRSLEESRDLTEELMSKTLFNIMPTREMRMTFSQIRSLEELRNLTEVLKIKTLSNSTMKMTLRISTQLKILLLKEDLPNLEWLRMRDTIDSSNQMEKFQLINLMFKFLMMFTWLESTESHSCMRTNYLRILRRISCKSNLMRFKTLWINKLKKMP